MEASAGELPWWKRVPSAGELPWYAKDSSTPSRKKHCSLKDPLGGGGVHLHRAEPEEG